MHTFPTMSTRLRRGEREEYHFDLSAVRQLLHRVSVFRVVLKQDRHLECRCLWGPPHKRKRGKFKYMENTPQTHRLYLKHLRQCVQFHYNVMCSWKTSFSTFSNIKVILNFLLKCFVHVNTHKYPHSIIQINTYSPIWYIKKHQSSNLFLHKRQEKLSFGTLLTQNILNYIWFFYPKYFAV